MRTASGWLKIKAKAAATRHIAGFAFHLACQYCTEDIRIVVVTQLLLEFYTLIEAEGLHMRQAPINRIEEIGFELCALYANLSADAALPPATKAWKMTPNFHLFCHMCQWIIPNNGLNPRSYWCYADEDLVGNLIEVAETCHPSTMSVVAMTKFALCAYD